MKKKVQEKKQIIPIFTPSSFWTYKIYTPQQLLQIDTFLTNFDKQLKAIIIESSLQANIKILFEKIGLNIHPSLLPKAKSPELKSLSEDGYGQRYIIFLNHKIDTATLKLVAYILSFVKINTLKFSNNSFSEQEIKILTSLINKEENASTVFFEWNNINHLPNANNFYTSLLRPCVSSLILRSCKIGNNVLKQIVNKIVGNQDSKLKYLDLYDNNISAQSLPSISKLIEQNKSIQFLSLSKNLIHRSEQLEAIFKCIGNVKLSEQEYVNYKKIQKQREDILERNKKRKKGVPQQPIPFLLPIQQIDNQWFYIKNHKLKNLYFGWNNIKQQSLHSIKNFMERLQYRKQDQQFELNLIGNDFGNSTTALLKDIKGIKI